MKKFILFSLAILLSLPAFSQRDETALHNPGIKLTGFWGGGISRMHNFNSDHNYAHGSYFAFELNKNILIGWDRFTLKKSIPDSVSIEVDSYSVHNTYNPMNFDVIPNYLVYLVIHYTWDANVIKSTDTLTEIVNTAFSMTYHDKTNMSFRVKNVVIPKRDYEREFFDFFVKK